MHSVKREHGAGMQMSGAASDLPAGRTAGPNAAILVICRNTNINTEGDRVMPTTQGRLSKRAGTYQTVKKSAEPTRFRLRPIAAVCAGLLGGTLTLIQAPALAQQADNASSGQAQGASDVQSVVVTGIRAGIEGSISKKKNSDSIVEAITSEDIGKLPDISIAEAMARMPGLAAQQVNGRAQVIAIRGLAPDFAGTVLNGREQASVGTNRGVEFDQYPAELISAVVVYKTPDAALLGQGLSGTVDLNTVRPLAFRERTFALNIRGEHNSLGDLNHGYGGTSANGKRFSISYIDQFAHRTIGLAVGFAHLDAPGQQHGYQAWGWQTDSNCIAHQTDWGCRPIAGTSPGNAYYLSGFQAESISRNDTRNGLMASLEYKPGTDLHSSLDLYYSKFKNVEVMRGLMGSLGDGWGYPGSTFSNVGTTDAGGQPVVTSVTSNFVTNGVVRNDYNTRDDALKSAGWNIDKRIGEWRATADLSYSSANRAESQFETYAGATTSPTFDLVTPTGSGFPTFSFHNSLSDPTTILLSDPVGWGGVGTPQLGRKQYNEQMDTIRALRLQATRDVEWSIFDKIDFGINLSRRDKTRNFHVDFARVKDGILARQLPSSVLTTPTSLDFVGVPSVLSYDVNAVAANFYNMVTNPSLGPGGDNGKTFGVHEKVSTAYVKLDIDTAIGGIPLHGNVGVQAIHTRQDSTAYAFDAAGYIIGTIDPGTHYNDYLPSLNLVADIGGDRKLRLGAAKTMARPRIDDMNAAAGVGVDLSTHLWSGGGGNPKLQPWRAKSLDISLEQYFGKRSYVSGALFYKKLDSYIYNSTIPYDFSGYINPTPAIVPVTNMGTYSTQANGNGGRVRGAELSATLDGELVNPMLAGFGAIATASFTDSSIKPSGPNSTDSWQTLPGLSKWVGGLTLYYERNGYSFRINDRYRSDYRGEYAYLFGSTLLNRTLASNKVDLQASYEIQGGAAKGLQLMFQVGNVTNAPDRTVQDGTGFGGIVQPKDYNIYGRQFLLGMNYKFH
ncbi:TonB-dependent receptor [Massilia sp. Root335]|uniref:TonB-dependent receptor n=1 Tax=Massilia sp. Root335 TaxID=1736517 RepID=UPI001E622A6F|nr:TonB-dependent receptor [Massilia sp. Root335]